MNKNKYINFLIFSFVHLLICTSIFAQQNKTDSLITFLKITKEDTSKVNTLHSLFLEHEFTDEQKAEKYLNEALELSQKINFKKGLASTYIYLGYFAEDKGNYPDALKNYFASLKISNTTGDKKGIASSYNFIGLIYYRQGNYPEALKNFLASLKISEILKDKNSIANSYGNIGNVYGKQGNFSDALKNHFACLKIAEQEGNKASASASYINIGTVYYDQGNYSEALKHFLSSIKIMEEMDYKQGIAYTYSNIGGIYYAQLNYPEALKNYLLSFKIAETIGDKPAIAVGYYNIGNIFTRQKKFNEANIYLLKAKELSLEIGYKECLRDTYSSLTNLDSAKGNFKEAYENHKLYILYRDSLDNEETRKKTIQSQMTYDFEKKEDATKAEQNKKDALAEEDKKRQHLFLLFLAALATSIGVIAIVIFRGLQQSKKAKKVIELQRDEITQQKELVEHQKNLVEEHQKEILDSITYAKRIQYSLLANKQLMDDNLNGNVISSSDKGGVSGNENSEAVPGTSTQGTCIRTDSNYFILFKPKDIVSGDFYWATKKTDIRQSTNGKEEIIERFYIAACDSTGHGVPGAFMSLLNISFLNEAVNEKNIVEPHEILNHVRKRLIENMDGGQDGMDCILLCFETSTPSPLLEKKRGEEVVRCTYAAANNSPAIIQNGKLISLPADKMPVGKGENEAPFTLRTIETEKGDILYLYTDGYADQFGGPKGKKFKYKQLDELIVAISNLPSNEQSEILNKKFEDWKGNLEQVDDMLVIGIRI